jgi:hypothetical protein
MHRGRGHEAPSASNAAKLGGFRRKLTAAAACAATWHSMLEGQTNIFINTIFPDKRFCPGADAETAARRFAGTEDGLPMVCLELRRSRALNAPGGHGRYGGRHRRFDFRNGRDLMRGLAQGGRPRRVFPVSFLAR